MPTAIIGFFFFFFVPLPHAQPGANVTNACRIAALNYKAAAEQFNADNAVKFI
jgi:hypothetical protein